MTMSVRSDPRSMGTTRLGPVSRPSPWRLMRDNAVGLAVTYMLFVAENLLSLIRPWLLGAAVQGMTQARIGPALAFLGQIGASAIIGSSRRRFDARFFNGIHGRMAGKWAVEQRANGLEVAAVSARAVLARQIVDFLQRDLPLVVQVIFQFVGAVVLLWFNEPSLLIGCALMTGVVLLRCPSFLGGTKLWNERLHDQLEREVNVLETADPHEVEAHYGLLAQCQVRLAELQASQFAFSELMTAALIGFAFWHQSRGSAPIGRIVTVLGYLQIFTASLTNLFPWLQQCMRLRDVVDRLRSESIPDGQATSSRP